MEDLKKCSQCDKELPKTSEYFYRCKRTHDGFYTICKQCFKTGYRKEKKIAKDGFKICSNCDKELPATNEFYHNDKIGRLGLRSWCKECSSIANKSHESSVAKKKWRSANKERLKESARQYYIANRERVREAEIKYSSSDLAKFRRRKSHYKRMYDLSEDQVRDLLDLQKGCCAICGESLDTSYDVDHCHKTGKVRELLCGSCNKAIGYLREDRNIAIAAAKYLEKHNG